MPITLKYGNPGAVALAGYAGGVGKRQQRQQDESLDIWHQQQQQQFQAEQANTDRMFRFGMQQQGFGQQQALQQAGFAQQANLQQAGFAQDALQRDFQAGQQKALIDARAGESGLDRKHSAMMAKQQQEFMRDQATLQGLRSGQLELPPEAQSRMQKLDAGRVEAMKLDEAGQAEYMAKYEQETAALRRLAQPKAELSVGDDFAKNTLEKDGTLYQRTKDGGFDVLKKGPEEQEAKRTEQYQADSQAHGKEVLKEAQRLQGEDFKANAKASKDLATYVEQAKSNLEAAGVKAPQPYMDVSGVDAKALAKWGGFELEGGLTKIPPAPGQNPPPPSLSTARSNMPPGPPGTQNISYSAGDQDGDTFTLDKLGKEDRAMAEKFLPRPISAEDRAKLPPNTRYIAPDGSIRTWEGTGG